MREKVDALREKFQAQLEGVKDPQKLEELRLSFMSKKGAIQDLMKELSQIPNEQKKEAGQMINSFKQEVSSKFEAKLEFSLVPVTPIEETK